MGRVTFAPAAFARRRGLPILGRIEALIALALAPDAGVVCNPTGCCAILRGVVPTLYGIDAAMGLMTPKTLIELVEAGWLRPSAFTPFSGQHVVYRQVRRPSAHQIAAWRREIHDRRLAGESRT